MLALGDSLRVQQRRKVNPYDVVNNYTLPCLYTLWSVCDVHAVLILQRSRMVKGSRPQSREREAA